MSHAIATIYLPFSKTVGCRGVSRVDDLLKQAAWSLRRSGCFQPGDQLAGLPEVTFPANSCD
jgi:hypothetical protein